MRLGGLAIRFLLAAGFSALALPGVAASFVCKNDSSNEKMGCTSSVESSEFTANCPKPGTLSILGGSKHCGHSLFPTLKWKAIEDEDPAVTVDPAPGQLAGAASLFGHGGRKGYALQQTAIDYQIGSRDPVHVVCDGPDNAAFRCDISTGFASLDCDLSLDPSLSLTIQASGVYKKPGAADEAFKGDPVTFNYANLVRQICDARMQLQKNRETDKDHRAAE